MSPVRVAMGMVVVVMIMAAVRAMHMRLSMLMVAVIMMGVIVVMVIMRAVTMMVMPVIMVMMIVIVAMNRRGGDIGAAFRIERRFDFDDCRAKAPRHVFDHVIAPDAQAFLQEFGRQMPIAQVPGDAHERGRVGAANLRQTFGCGDDFDDAPVLQRQAVAGAQHHGFGQIEQEGEPAHAGHGDAAAIAVFIIEDDRVGGFAGPGAGGTNGMSVLHGLAGFW